MTDQPNFDRLQELVEQGIRLHEISGVKHPLSETIADVLLPEYEKLYNDAYFTIRLPRLPRFLRRDK